MIQYNSAASAVEAEATVAAVSDTGAKAVAIQADLTSAGAMDKLFAQATGQTILVNGRYTTK